MIKSLVARTVQGIIESTLGGFKFPDGSIQISASKIQDYKNIYERTDFLDNAATQYIWAGTAIGTGGTGNGVPTTNRTAAHQGTVLLRNGTAVNTGFTYRSQISNIATSPGLEFNAIFNLASTTASGYNTNTVFRLGFFDSISNTESTDQIAIYKAAGSLDLIGRVVNNGTVSDTAALGTMTALTWYRVNVKVNSAGTGATFTMFDDFGNVIGSATISSGLPTGGSRLYGSGVVLYHTTETTSRDLMELDFMDLTIPQIGRG
jgi:hypothetical protein